MLNLPINPSTIAGLGGRPTGVSGVCAVVLCFMLILTVPFDVRSALVATDDGTNTNTPPTTSAPPPNDPGFYNVGLDNGKGAVYVGNGWVLTANHVGFHPVTLRDPVSLVSVVYDPVPGSRVQFQKDSILADLIAFKLLGPDPPLPALTIADSAPTSGTLVTVIGNGVARGSVTSWMGVAGWNWNANKFIRWGTNRIDEADADLTYSLDTQSFSTVFDDPHPNPPAGEHEADIVPGDSGGAAFTGSGGSAKLIGILWARIPTLVNQPASGSFYTNIGLITDLFAYRSDILAVIDQPECSDGLDDDGDGLVDYPNDPGCSDSLDADERGASFVCDNGADDDGDGLFDYPDDPDCLSPTHDSESPPVFAPTSSLGAVVLALALYVRGRRQLALRRGSALVD